MRSTRGRLRPHDVPRGGFAPVLPPPICSDPGRRTLMELDLIDIKCDELQIRHDVLASQ